jgi:hypothetical protein
MRRSLPALVLALAVCGAGTVRSAAAANPVITDPARTDADYSIQGEYLGDLTAGDKPRRFGVQVIAGGEGRFDVVAYPGGLPGAGGSVQERAVGKAVRGGDAVVVEQLDLGPGLKKVEIRDGAIIVQHDGGTESRLPRRVRTSPTLGQKPPQAAILIYDGLNGSTDTDKLVGGRAGEDGLLMEGTTSKDSFGDALWHIEFRTPYQSRDRGQGRGNSGVYVQSAYEVQVLDSFGLKGENNECGGIYGVRAPLVNMCLPPLQWQTYDIEFTAPRFAEGKKTSNAKMTVRHNGVVVQQDTEVPGPTTAAPAAKEQPTGPLHLQQHGNPVRYRNVWVLPKG